MTPTEKFYRAFEDRFRGSREMILLRLDVYLEFLRPLAALFEKPSAVDLGCGRGEFLEVLISAGFEAKGADLDTGMLQACEELGLPAEKCDALAFLAALPDASQAVVSAFHLVEHLQFEELQTLVAEAHRVLKPGGLMILETPNPENIVVASTTFYLDPTHQKPIPAALLAFVAEYNGFSRIVTVRLQEDSRLKVKERLSLQDILAGTSPDYAIVAQKSGPENIKEALNVVFEKDYGLALGELTDRYEAGWQHLHAKLAQAEAKAAQAEARAQQAQRKADQLAKTATEAFAQLHAVYASTSWQVSAPLRWIKRAVILSQPTETKRNAYPRDPSGRAVNHLYKRPKLKKLVRSIVGTLSSLSRSLPAKGHNQLRGDSIIAGPNATAGFEAQDFGPCLKSGQRWLESDDLEPTIEEILNRIQRELGRSTKS